MQIQTSNYPLLANYSQLSGKITPDQTAQKTDEDQKKLNATVSASQNTTAPTKNDNTDDKNLAETNEQTANSLSLDENDLKQIDELKRRDAEVRAHEAAHLAAAGKHATGGASYKYTRGPDGKSYASSGEVSIDTSPIPGSPEATLQKAQQILAAAQAPAQPSAQDRQVAAQATIMASDARIEITQNKTELNSEKKASEDRPEKTNENAKNEYQNIESIIDDEQNNPTPLINQMV